MDVNYAWKLFERTGAVKDYIAYKTASGEADQCGEKVKADAYQNNGNRPLQAGDGGQRFDRHNTYG